MDAGACAPSSQSFIKSLMRTHVWRRAFVISVTACLIAALPAHSGNDQGDHIKPGDKLQALANLHPDMQRHVLYTLNYQLPGLLPVCSEITVTKVSSRKLTFTWQGVQYEMGYEKYTQQVGVSFQQAVLTYFGSACDKAKMQKLGPADQEGIRTGQPAAGMTRDGVLFAMGRPPIHANPDLNAPQWRYWRNRYVTQSIEFDAQGKVSRVVQ